MGLELSVEVHGNTSWFISVCQGPWKSAPSTTCRPTDTGWAGGGVGRAASGPAPTGLKRAFGVAAPCPFGARLTPGPLRTLARDLQGRAMPCPALRPPHPTTGLAGPVLTPPGGTGTTRNATANDQRTDRQRRRSGSRSEAVGDMTTPRNRAGTVAVTDTGRPQTRPERDRPGCGEAAGFRARGGAGAGRFVADADAGQHVRVSRRPGRGGGSPGVVARPGPRRPGGWWWP
jgi:hypothetical protein